ncbi:uncharacterized protein ACNLHF_001554 [Anomaloglossus baeobatrachus]|uniref:uncharacterized protein LOC142312804 n=1 Tax=Anomaloglossus baeobatrachus TaxID=238106 RepID=UPI003F509500
MSTPVGLAPIQTRKPHLLDRMKYSLGHVVLEINFDLLKFIMAWFQRMKIDVAKLIAMVESMPCLWDPTCPDYMQKNKRMDCWGTICAELFPQWHEADAALQHKIELDVRKRWRSVKDRFHKIRNEGMKSGSSPKKPNFIYYDELSFLCTSRKTRETSGNVAVQTPVDDEEGQESLLQPHQEGPSANIDQFSSEHEGDIESGTVQDKSPPRPTIITSGPTKYIKPKNKKKNTKNIQLEEDVICNETLKLLNTSAKEDDIDHFGISIAGRIRKIKDEKKKNTCMTAICGMLTCYEEEGSFPSSGAIISKIEQFFDDVKNPPAQKNTATIAHNPIYIQKPYSLNTNTYNQNVPQQYLHPGIQTQKPQSSQINIQPPLNVNLHSQQPPQGYFSRQLFSEP